MSWFSSSDDDGVAGDKIELKTPEGATATDTNAGALRVNAALGAQWQGSEIDQVAP